MCNYFTTFNPSIKEFRESFEQVAAECSVDGVMMMSHKITSDVSIDCQNDYDNDYDLIAMDVSRLGGCGCWVAPRLVIRRNVSENSWDFEQLMKKMYPEQENIIEKNNNGEYQFVQKEWNIWKIARGVEK